MCFIWLHIRLLFSIVLVIDMGCQKFKFSLISYIITIGTLNFKFFFINLVNYKKSLREKMQQKRKGLKTFKKCQAVLDQQRG